MGSFQNKHYSAGGTAFGENSFLKTTFLQINVPKNQFSLKMTKNYVFFEKLSKKGRARTTATTATTAEEFSQSIQVPSSTHPGTTYPVRTIPHSDLGTNGFASADMFWKTVRYVTHAVLITLN